MSWCGGGEIRVTPGVAWRRRAISTGHLEAGQLAALAGLGTLRDLDLELAGSAFRYSAVTPNRPDATCLIGELALSPFGARREALLALAALAASALAPIRFMAMVSVSCASGDSAPSDMPGVTKRLRISVMLSTSSSGTGALLAAKSSRSRIEIGSCAVQHLGIALEGLVAVGGTACCSWWITLRFQRVGLAAAAVAVEAADRQRRLRRRQARACSSRTRFSMPVRPMPEMRRQAWEVFAAERARQAHRLEVVAAAVGADDRDAHLGHDLQQALVDRLLEAGQALLERQAGEQAAGDAGRRSRPRRGRRSRRWPRRRSAPRNSGRRGTRPSAPRGS